MISSFKVVVIGIDTFLESLYPIMKHFVKTIKWNFTQNLSNVERK